MTDYITAIYEQYFAYQNTEQTNLRREVGGWYVGDKLVVGFTAVNLSTEIIRAIYATSARAIIAPKIAELEDLGFCQIYKMQGSLNWIRIRFRSAIFETHRVKLLILKGGLSVVAKTAGRCSRFIEDFTIHDKIYMRQLAAAKNRRTRIIAVIFERLPQPIAEEIAPDVLLCKI